MAGYRHALEIDPYLVPALINLANIHYSRDEIAEAQALYERAMPSSRTCSRRTSTSATSCTTSAATPRRRRAIAQALHLNPAYADAHSTWR